MNYIAKYRLMISTKQKLVAIIFRSSFPTSKSILFSCAKKYFQIYYHIFAQVVEVVFKTVEVHSSVAATAFCLVFLVSF